MVKRVDIEEVEEDRACRGVDLEKRDRRGKDIFSLSLESSSSKEAEDKEKRVDEEGAIKEREDSELALECVLLLLFEAVEGGTLDESTELVRE